MALFSPVERQKNDVYGVHRHGAVRVGLEATVSALENHGASRRLKLNHNDLKTVIQL